MDPQDDPVAARRLGPYTGAGAVAAASRPAGTVENSSAKPAVPTIAPAIASAVFKLTAQRLRALPLKLA